MIIEIELQNIIGTKAIPSKSQLQQWVDEAFSTVSKAFTKKQRHITIRIINKEESAQLNEDFRHKKGPTNILSFSSNPIPGFDPDSIGDLAICGPLVIEEAKAQEKDLLSHWAHLIVHGILHLAGYDHETDEDAETMENLEIKILKKIGYDSPY